MMAVMVPDHRGKASRITAWVVRQMVGEAKEIKAKGGRVRLKAFVKELSEKHGIVLDRKKVTEGLIANGLYRAGARSIKKQDIERLESSNRI